MISLYKIIPTLALVSMTLYARADEVLSFKQARRQLGTLVQQAHNQYAQQRYNNIDWTALEKAYNDEKAHIPILAYNLATQIMPSLCDLAISDRDDLIPNAVQCARARKEGYQATLNEAVHALSTCSENDAPQCATHLINLWALILMEPYFIKDDSTWPDATA